MYVYIGGDYSLYQSDIVAVLDFENITTRENGRAYLTRSEKERRLIYACEKGSIPRSVVVAFDREKKESMVYISGHNTSKLLGDSRRASKRSLP